MKTVSKSTGIAIKSGAKLKELPVYEASGMIWVSLGTPIEDADSFLSDIPNALRKYRLAEMVPVEARDFSLSVNWKICLENALDYYHVSTVHGKSVDALVRDHQPLKQKAAFVVNVAHCAWMEKVV